MYESQGQSSEFILSGTKRKELTEAFQIFDVLNIEKIEFAYMKVLVEAYGFYVNKSDVMEPETTNDMVTYDTYMEFMSNKYAQADPSDEFKRVFSTLKTEDGKITIETLKTLVSDIGENIDLTDLEAIINEFDSDNDGALTSSDFAEIMREASALPSL